MYYMLLLVGEEVKEYRYIYTNFINIMDPWKNIQETIIISTSGEKSGLSERWGWERLRYCILFHNRQPRGFMNIMLSQAFNAYFNAYSMLICTFIVQKLR